MIAGYILTGGKNKRMNGKKKLFLTFRDIPFYEYILHAFRIFPNVYLSVEEEAPYKNLHLPMVTDLYPDIGPIGGIYSGLVLCREDALFVAACDMPFIHDKIVNMFCEIYKTNPNKIIVGKTGQRIHPLFGIYPKSVLPVLQKQIDQKDYKVRNLLINSELFTLELGNDPAVRNINTSAEYAKLEYMKRKTNGTEIQSF